MFQHICAWCGKELSPPEDNGKTENLISHGICDICYIKMIADLSKSLEEFLNKILKPVFIVDQEGEMISANKFAQKMVEKDINSIKGYLGGDVFGCKYAKLPGGCGATIHCRSCTIRTAVMQTFTTGKNQYNIPCHLDHESGQKIQFLISVEKKGETVLIRIDEVGGDKSHSVP